MRLCALLAVLLGSLLGASSAYAIRKPVQTSPAAGAHVQSVPAFGWKPVRGAAGYEFELAADSAFRSPVDNGSFKTKNAWATIDKALPDATYYWRVRAIDKKNRASKWSPARTIEKSWTAVASIIGPADGTSIVYPTNPLVLRWQPIPYAHKYLVTIATDPSLAQPAVTQAGGRLQFSSSGQPIETPMPAFALAASLPAGRYYWAVTPEDARGHRGKRSAVQSFDWSWPTNTSLRVNNLMSQQGNYDPQFSWDPVPGAARYEVEVNSTPDFTLGAKVCCSGPTTGTSLTPTQTLNNDTSGNPPGGYWWRVRALDLAGNAGRWNYGAPFRREFDDLSTTIPNLRIRNNQGEFADGSNAENQVVDPNTGPQTVSPVVAWNQVDGANSYDVQVVPFEFGGCNWSAQSFRNDVYLSNTATTAWTPVAVQASGPALPWQGTVTTDGKHLNNGQPYCVRVRARADRDASFKDVLSAWTKIGAADKPSFTFTGNQNSGVCTKLTIPAASYREPAPDQTTMPLFTWDPVPGAGSYFVVVATDNTFAHIIDQALVNQPAYAPRGASSAKTYPDANAYYYVVMPAASANGNCMQVFDPAEDNPHTFNKLSVPPTIMEPASGSDVTGQPTFRWSTTAGARNYRLQVSQDPSFSDLIDDVTTSSTAYTSSSTYPADTVVYWRVRANDALNTGLAWSQVGTFRRRLPAPGLGAFDPLRAEMPPVLSWSPVQGATSYDVHLEQADGVQRDFNGLLGTAATWTQFYGTGTSRIQVRAAFPTRVSGETPGPWSAPQAFTRYINPPPEARGSLTKGKALVSWSPSPIGKQYRVQIAASNSFVTPITTVTTDNTSYAPDLNSPAYTNGSALYWRVAAVDDGNNIGAWQDGVFRKPRALKVRAKAKGRVRRGRRARITVYVRDSRRRPVSRVRVTVSGAGVTAKPRRTSRKGKVVFAVKALAKGKLVFTAGKDGWAPGQANVRVR